MNRIRFAFAVAFALSLAGCAAPPSSSSATQATSLPPEVMPADPEPESRPTTPTSDTLCDASKGQWAIGQTATPEVVERVRVETGSRMARVNRPGDPGYEHYSPARVEIAVDGRNAITGITCG